MIVAVSTGLKDPSKLSPETLEALRDLVIVGARILVAEQRKHEPERVPRAGYDSTATRQAVGELRAFATHLARGPAVLTAAQLDHVLDIMCDVLSVGGVGVCRVCDRVAPLSDEECPDCRH